MKDHDDARNLVSAEATEVPDANNLTLESAANIYVTRYRQNIATAKSERAIISSFRETKLGRLKLPKVTHRAIEAYCRARLAHVRPATVRNELRLIRYTVEIARREWGLALLENPAMGIDLPPNARPLPAPTAEDVTALCATLAGNPVMRAIVIVAVETRLNRHELLPLEWADIDLDKKEALIRGTRTIKARTVPLSDRAIQALRELEAPYFRVFHMTHKRLQRDFEEACRKAKLTLGFHELRRVRRAAGSV